MSRTMAGRAENDEHITELASGIDALYLSGRGVLRHGFLEELAYQRDLAEAQLPASIQLGPLSFAMAARPWWKYRYYIDHPVGRIGFSASSHLPAIRVQPRSEFLHGVGVAQAVETFVELLRPVGHDLSFGVSRVDLYVDVTGFPLDLVENDRFLCRANSRRIYETDGKVNGIEFGHRGAAICARVYDKTLDVELKGTDWWYEIWGDGLDSDSRVTRVELEFGRKALTQFDLDIPAAVLEAVPGLWHYGTAEWLSHRCPSSDSNRTRWPLSPQWQAVRRASLRGSVASIERLQNRGRAGSLRRLTPGLIGYLVAFGALAHTTGIVDTLQALDGHIRNDEIVRRRQFAERLEERRIATGQP